MKTFNALKLLCILVLLLASTSYAQTTSGTVKATFVRATIPYTSLTGLYVTILPNTRKLLGCTFTNATNAAIDWSDSSVAIVENQPSLSKEFYDFASNRVHVSTNIQVKYTVGAPTIGNVYVNCYY